MPKGTNARRPAVRGKVLSEGLSKSTHGGNGTISGMKEKDVTAAQARITVGDQGVMKAKYGNRVVNTALPTDEQDTPNEKKAKAAKMTAKVDNAIGKTKAAMKDDFSAAVDMVRKKKSSKSSSYQ